MATEVKRSKMRKAKFSVCKKLKESTRGIQELLDIVHFKVLVRRNSESSRSKNNLAEAHGESADRAGVDD